MKRKAKKISPFWIILIVLLIFFFAGGYYLSSLWVTVPDLTGKSLEQAQEILGAKKLNVLVKSPESYFPGYVVAVQYPAAGRRLVPKSRIHLYLTLAGKARVPYLLGLNKAEALYVLQNLNLMWVIETKSSGFAKDTIIRQDPPPDSWYQVKDKVHLTFSRGLTGLEAPDLIGKSLIEAQEILRPLGLKLTVEENLPAKDAQIVKQDPSAGEALLKAEIKVSCQETIVVPELRGKSLTTALKILAKSGLKLGKIDYQNLPATPKGMVMEQNPPGGLEVDPATTIDLTVSNGKRR